MHCRARSIAAASPSTSLDPVCAGEEETSRLKRAYPSKVNFLSRTRFNGIFFMLRDFINSVINLVAYILSWCMNVLDLNLKPLRGKMLGFDWRNLHST